MQLCQCVLYGKNPAERVAHGYLGNLISSRGLGRNVSSAQRCGIKVKHVRYVRTPSAPKAETDQSPS